MLRAGMIRQQAAGIYSWLPLGKRVLDKVGQIVREEQNRAGAIEILMPTIQSADLWRESGRYDDYGKEMLRIKDRHERDMLYGPTNEEMVTEIFRAYVKSYKDLPLNLYHIQWKFRDEVRPRFGVMRGREFLMKDAYSFDLDFEGAKAAYNRMFVAYLRTFTRMGLKAIPMRADTGPIGGDLSHEFIILADTGESQVFCHRDFLDMPVPGEDIDFADDAEIGGIVERVDVALRRDRRDARRGGLRRRSPKATALSARGIEVGHIFYFGDKYSKPMGAKVTGPDGKDHSVSMGSYGIGLSRLVAAIIEASHDENGIIWPEASRRSRSALINMRPATPTATASASELYAALTGGRHRRALRRHRPARRRQVRHRRPDRPALAGDRRAARRRGRRGRDQAPRDRRARDAADRRRCGQPLASRMSEPRRRQPPASRPSRPAPARSRPSSAWSPGAICARGARRRSSR